MRTIRVVLAALLLPCVVFAADPYREIMRRFDRAKAAIEAGDVSPERDLAPLVALLTTTANDPENLERVIDKIETLGDASGSSPAAVKKYLLEESTPLLIDIAGNRAYKPTLRGTAINALRDMHAPRAVLQQVADMALADPDSFVQSRGEILANFVSSMPEVDESPSIELLRLAAIETRVDDVKALLADGADPNEGPAEDSPLNRAISACAHQGDETDAVLETIDALIAGGADVKRRDANKNAPLLSAAQYCGPRVVSRLLAAGADVNATNAMDISPLSFALILGKFDTADVLVAKGARLTPSQVQMMSSTVTDARGKAIVKKASAAKKK